MSMGKRRALSRTALEVLSAFLESPADAKYGLQLMKETGIQAGSLYPILQRFEDQGWIEADWEDADPSREGRPRRRYYNMTGLGQEAARQELRSALGRLSVRWA